MKCPYCDSESEKVTNIKHYGYRECENDHTFHIDDWS